MSLSKGTPASSQIIWLEGEVERLRKLLSETNTYYAECIAQREDLRDEKAKLREALIDMTSCLVAAVSLLERGGKKAAPSDKMFAIMLEDYRASVDRAAAVYEETDNAP